MKKIRSILLFILFLFLINNSNATVYYISNSGDDLNNGISPVYPIRSIEKLNSIIYKLQPGDAVLFERGSVFYGQVLINTSGGDISNPVIFSSYGKGKMPVISGSVPVTNWSLYQGNIYKAKVNADVKNIFMNNIQMTLARYPNSGYLKIDKPFSNAKNGFLDNELNQGKDYWSGSIVRIRTINWAFEHTPVRSFYNGSITFSNPTFYPAQTGWGYYLDNNLNELDAEKEWYYQKNSEGNGIVYFQPLNSINPNSSDIQASVHDFGFVSYQYKANIIIQNLNFINQNISGIYFTGNVKNVKVLGCSFTGQDQLGISLAGSSENVNVYNCRFYNINGKAIYMVGANSSVISNNIFRNIGMTPGYGTTPDVFGMSGIVALDCNSTSIYKNIIENIGHDGINCIGNSNRIEKNIITNTLLILNDGAAIKSYGKNNSKTVWENNFIFNVPGNFDAASKFENRILAFGIYLDEDCSDMEIINNTVVKSGLAGIFLYNGCNNNLFKGNTCYDNSSGIFFYRGEKSMRGNTADSNILFGIKEDQYSVTFKADNKNFIPGILENNIYCNPSGSKIFSFEHGNVLSDYSFDQWKSLTGKNSNINSRIISGQEALHSKIFYNMNDDSMAIILNSEIIYKDLNYNSVFGSLIIPPYSSVILLGDKNSDALPDIYTAGGPLEFGKSEDRNAQDLLWYKLIGNNIKGYVTVKAPDGFEVSEYPDQNFSNSLKIDPVSEKIDRIIFIKFLAESDKGNYGYITNETGLLKEFVRN